MILASDRSKKYQLRQPLIVMGGDAGMIPPMTHLTYEGAQWVRVAIPICVQSRRRDGRVERRREGGGKEEGRRREGGGKEEGRRREGGGKEEGMIERAARNEQ